MARGRIASGEKKRTVGLRMSSRVIAVLDHLNKTTGRSKTEIMESAVIFWAKNWKAEDLKRRLSLKKVEIDLATNRLTALGEEVKNLEAELEKIREAG